VSGIELIGAVIERVLRSEIGHVVCSGT
jgi:hypothetical protein